MPAAASATAKLTRFSKAKPATKVAGFFYCRSRPKRFSSSCSLIHFGRHAMRLGLAICFLMLSGAAQAITLTQKGDAIYLKGAIRPGDHIVLREFLASAAPKPRIIFLHSPGGGTYEAQQMARMIRASELVTAIDGRTYCRSACPGLFAAGVKRHYFNSAGIEDHLGKKNEMGLGYHEGHDGNETGLGIRQSGKASSQMIDVFYEHGSPAAAQFVPKAPPDKMYYVSGATALALGLATSLSPP